jgi:hypothetical protein
MVGKRYGDLTVLAEGPRVTFADGGMQRTVRVRCKCGTEWEPQAQHVRQGSTRRCPECAGRRKAVRGRTSMSVKLPDGWTIAQIALAYSLPLDTVYARWRRGWPAEKLSLPVGQYRGSGEGLGYCERVRPAVTREHREQSCA